MRRKDREIKDPGKIQEVLEACKVCRLGMTDDEGQVYIVPMNHGYRFEDGRLVIYFHGAREGKKLALLKKNPLVGIEMDCGHKLKEGDLACQYTYLYASIIGNGRAKIVTEPKDKLEALSVIMKHQTGREFPEFAANPKLERAVAVIRVEVETYTCKQNEG